VRVLPVGEGAVTVDANYVWDQVVGHSPPPRHLPSLVNHHRGHLPHSPIVGIRVYSRGITLGITVVVIRIRVRVRYWGQMSATVISGEHGSGDGRGQMSYVCRTTWGRRSAGSRPMQIRASVAVARPLISVRQDRSPFAGLVSTATVW